MNDSARRDHLVLTVWLATRLALVVTAFAVMQRTGASLDTVLSRWDVQHYLAIARNGYADPQNMAFFPGIPLLLRAAGAAGLSMTLSGALLSNLAALLAALALARLGGSLAGCAWLLAPMAVFTSVPYTEAIFCALAFWSWLLARRGRWPLSAGLAAAACCVRVSGLFLVAGLAVLALSGGEPSPAGAETAVREPSWRARGRNLCWALLAGLVVLGFVIYLHALTGSWQAWFGAQRAGWQRSFLPPWQGLQNTLFATHPQSWPNEPSRAWMFRFEIASVAIGYLTAIGCAIRRAWGQAVYVLVQVLALSCTTWFISVNRAVLLWFPLFVAIGSVASRRGGSMGLRGGRVVVIAAGVAAGLALLVWWASLFYAGHWAS
ncbi:Mannosyltransferase (PIG-V) [Propionibacterium cyclohexanicum]|uniref:Mannosyltransferase (PIG-V) n=1 Tax=Propionibacterium cyclohexanicum TaxID=64702 RepID=A0A1H9TQ61_9ACTN|nr:mannosyltransferase family protein [Propionibacterium cyclohexanicum]SER99302.1 Mannosyltransferase (PIG-V) [Propionibacterium cyclohexanicum]